MEFSKRRFGNARGCGLVLVEASGKKNFLRRTIGKPRYALHLSRTLPRRVLSGCFL